MWRGRLNLHHDFLDYHFLRKRETETRKLHISSHKVTKVEKGHFPTTSESFENKMAKSNKVLTAEALLPSSTTVFIASFTHLLFPHSGMKAATEDSLLSLYVFSQIICIKQLE
jgi:hypothetical protein